MTILILGAAPYIDAIDTDGETVSERVVAAHEFRPCLSCGEASSLLDHNDLCCACQPAEGT